MKNRIVAMTLLFSLVFSLCCFMQVQAEENYSEEYFLLKQMGIIPKDIIYKADAPINRGDFAYMVAKMIGCDDEDSTSLYFYDLEKEHYATNEIEYLRACGIVHGYSDKTFRPGVVLNYHDAISILLQIIGIGQNEKYYKNSYFPKKNILSDDTALTYDMAIGYIYEAMNTLVYTTDFDGNAVEYKLSDKTVLEKWRNISCYEGVVNTIGYKSIVGSNSKYRFTVGDLDLTVENPEDFNCLGFYSEVYYYNDKSEKSEQVICARAVKKNNDFKRFSADGAYYKSGKLYYYDNNIMKSITVPTDAFVCKNSESADTKNSEELFDINDGFITINKISKTGYTVILIEAYENYVVSSVNLTEGKIYSADNKNVVINEDGILDIRDSDSNKLSINDIQKNDIISVMQGSGSDKLVTQITVSRDKVTEKVISVTEDNDAYDIVTKSKRYTSVKNIDPELIPLVGSTVNIYINFEGKFIYTESGTSSEFIFGYLCRVRSDAESDENICYIDLFAEDGKMYKFAVAKKLKIDNAMCKTYDEVISALEMGTGIDDIYQPVRYKKNDEGILKEIDTAYCNKSAGESEHSLQPVFKCYNSHHERNTALGIFEGGLVYNSGTFENYFVVDNSAKAFKVPSKYESDIKMYNASVKFSNARYNIDAFTSDPDKLTADFIIQYASTGLTASSSAIGLIEDSFMAVNEDDEIVYKVLITNRKGEQNGYVIDSNFDMKDLHSKDSSVIFEQYTPTPGDCIQYSLNGNDEIVNIVPYYSVALDKWCFSAFETGTYEGSNDTSVPNVVLSSNERLYMGCLYNKNGSIIQLAMQDSRIISGIPQTRSMTIPANAKIFCCDKNGKLKKITIDDLETYQNAGSACHKVVVETYCNTPFLVVAYE